MTAKFALTVAVTYDPDLIDRLILNAREPFRTNRGPWIDGPQLARAMADQLEAARREVERLRPAVEAVERWSGEMPNSFAAIAPADLRAAIDRAGKGKT